MEKIRKEYIDIILNSKKTSLFKNFEEYITLDEIEYIYNNLLEVNLEKREEYRTKLEEATKLVKKVIDSIQTGNVDLISEEEKNKVEILLGLKGDRKYIYSKKDYKIVKVKLLNDNTPFELNEDELKLKEVLENSILMDKLKKRAKLLPEQIFEQCKLYLACATQIVSEMNQIILNVSNVDDVRINLEKMFELSTDISFVTEYVKENSISLCDLETLGKIVDLYDTLDDEHQLLKTMLFEIIKINSNEINAFNALVKNNDTENILSNMSLSKKNYLLLLGSSAPRKVSDKFITPTLTNGAVVILMKSIQEDENRIAKENGFEDYDSYIANKTQQSKMNSDGTINFVQYLFERRK